MRNLGRYAAIFGLVTLGIAACGGERRVIRKTGSGVDGEGGEDGGGSGGTSSSGKGGSKASGGKAAAIGGGPGSPSDPYGKVRTDGTVLLPDQGGDRAVKQDSWFSCVPHHGVFEAVLGCCVKTGVGTEEALTLTAQGIGDGTGCSISLDDSVNAGYITIDKAALAACEAAFAADIAAIKSCNGQRRVRDVQALTSPCEAAFVGKQGDGAPCIEDRDCVTGLACHGNVAAPVAPGKCGAPKGLGEACGRASSELDVVVPTAPVPNHPACVADAYCAGKCLELLELGADCEFNDACRSGLCRDTCSDPTDVGGGVEGFQCDHDEDCSPGLFCKPSELADEDFLCAPQMPAGSACTPDDGYGCAGGCVNGACAPLCGLL